MDSRQAWEAALGELQLQMTKATFDQWFRNSIVLSCIDGVLCIGLVNSYAVEWVENRLARVVTRTLATLGFTGTVRYMGPRPP